MFRDGGIIVDIHRIGRPLSFNDSFYEHGLILVKEDDFTDIQKLRILILFEEGQVIDLDVGGHGVGLEDVGDDALDGHMLALGGGIEHEDGGIEEEGCQDEDDQEEGNEGIQDLLAAGLGLEIAQDLLPACLGIESDQGLIGGEDRLVVVFSQAIETRPVTGDKAADQEADQDQAQGQEKINRAFPVNQVSDVLHDHPVGDDGRKAHLAPEDEERNRGEENQVTAIGGGLDQGRDKESQADDDP